MGVFEEIFGVYLNPSLTTGVILSLLLVVFVLSAYEFAVYRLISRRNFYDRSFHICLAVLPFFIATIVVCLQSNIVITLGTIGALAILRFRTAVKDPVDMLYLLWSVHIGITCGCRLYEVAVLTSLAVTLVLFLLERLSLGRRARILLVRIEPDREKELLGVIKDKAGNPRVISRKFTPEGEDLVISLFAGDVTPLTDALRAAKVSRFSVLDEDTEEML